MCVWDRFKCAFVYLYEQMCSYTCVCVRLCVCEFRDKMEKKIIGIWRGKQWRNFFSVSGLEKLRTLKHVCMKFIYMCLAVWNIFSCKYNFLKRIMWTELDSFKDLNSYNETCDIFKGWIKYVYYLCLYFMLYFKNDNISWKLLMRTVSAVW